MKNLDAEPTREERDLIESLVKYPSLENAFDRAAAPGFAEIKQKMQATVTNLERVIRRGERSDAERASVIVRAYRTTFDFLGELENIGKNQPR